MRRPRGASRLRGLLALVGSSQRVITSPRCRQSALFRLDPLPTPARSHSPLTSRSAPGAVTRNQPSESAVTATSPTVRNGAIAFVAHASAITPRLYQPEHRARSTRRSRHPAARTHGSTGGALSLRFAPRLRATESTAPAGGLARLAAQSSRWHPSPRSSAAASRTGAGRAPVCLAQKGIIKSPNPLATRTGSPDGSVSTGTARGSRPGRPTR